MSNVNTIKGRGKVNLYSPTSLDLAMNKPEVYNHIVSKYGKQYSDNTLANDLRLMENTMGISAESYTMFQEGWRWENIKLEAITGGSSSEEINVHSDSINSDGTMFAKPGYVIMFPGTYQTAYIKDVDYTGGSQTITLEASYGATLPAVAAGETVMVGTSAFGEASDQPKSSVKKYDKLTYYLQIIKDTVSISGSQATNDPWVDISEYDSPFDYYNTLVADADARMDKMESYAMMFSDGGYVVADQTMVDNGLADAVGDHVQYTKGLIPLAQDEGYELPTDATSADYTDFDDLDNYLHTQGDTSHYIMGRLGNKLAKAYSTALFDNVVTGNGVDVTANMLMKNGVDEQTARSRAVIMNYLQYEDASRCYMFKTADEFSDPKGYNSAGFNLNEAGVWMPMKNIESPDGGNIANVTMMHKERYGDNRRREFWDRKGAGGDSSNYVLTKDVQEAYMRSHVGLAVGAPNLITFSNPNA